MTQGMVGIINAMVAGVFGFLLAVFLGATTGEAITAGVLLLGVTLGLQVVVGVAMYRHLRESLTFHFPSVPEERNAPPTAETRPTAGRGLPPPGPGPSDRQKTPLGFVPRLRDYPHRANSADGHGTAPRATSKS
jgi:hypothetical protein